MPRFTSDFISSFPRRRGALRPRTPTVEGPHWARPGPDRPGPGRLAGLAQDGRGPGAQGARVRPLRRGQGPGSNPAGPLAGCRFSASSRTVTSHTHAAPGDGVRPRLPSWQATSPHAPTHPQPRQPRTREAIRCVLAGNVSRGRVVGRVGRISQGGRHGGRGGWGRKERRLAGPDSAGAR